MSSLRNRVHKNEKESKKLQEKVQQLTQKSGIYIDDEIHNDLVTTMRDNSKHLSSILPEESFANLFWQEQFKAASVKK